MQRLNGVVAALGLVLVGCAADEVETSAPVILTGEIDTPTQPARYDFSCYRVDGAKHAADPVKLDAFNYDSYAIDLLADAVVDLVAIDGDVVLDRAISDEAGALAFEVETHGAPLDHYTRTALDGFVTSYVYPSGPLVADELHRALPLLPPTWRDELAGFAGLAIEPGTGIVEVIVTDCAGYRVEGATVDFHAPGVTVAYWDPTFTDATATATTDNGHAWAFNVPAGEIDATITYDGMTWRSRPVRSFADGRTLSWRAP